MEKTMHHGQYRRLLFMMLLSFVSMFVLMYAMVDTVGNAVPNLNQFYMAGLMVAPMLLIELVLMGSMYPNASLNRALLAVGVVALAGFWAGIRHQTAIADVQFLKSMIPHHAGAILMCDEASLRDAEVQDLCKEILTSQKREIEQMKAMLKRIKS